MRSREEKNKDKQKEIEFEKNKEKVKKIVFLIIKIFIFTFLLLTFLFYYNKYVLNAGLIVNEEEVINEKIPTDISGLKIIQFSDLHYGSTVSLTEVDSLVKTINLRKPDIIIFTGDLIDKDYNLSLKEQEKLTKKLQGLKASLGKYAVSGEDDNKYFETILKQASFTILNNTYDLIYKDGNTPLLLTGIGNVADIESSFSYFKDPTHNSNIYTISIFHKPDTITEILNNQTVDLALSGHSHGGQIKIPYLPPLVRKEGAITYYKNYYKINNTKLFISSGIGCSKPYFRINARSSINLFRLRTKNLGK